MSSILIRIAFVTALISGLVVAQEETAPKPDKPTGGPTIEERPQAEPTDDATALRKKEKVRVLKPEEVPGEVMRLKTKADIKVEVSIKTYSGRPVVFKGVIRNGKLIERIVDRRFVAQKDVAHGRSGVRLWWSGDNDGFIFFRYTNIKSLAITGKLTATERAEIMRRLQAKKNGQDPDAAKRKAAAAAAAAKNPALEDLSLAERESWLFARYPAEKGWTSHRYRELKNKQILENVKLSKEDATFVQYFRVLERARYRNLRIATTEKEKFEPGSAESESEERKDVVKEDDKPAEDDD